ncbi:hypothetical protein V5799_010368 [Amblyomma americanum]|uniref:Uncharacterized protein n=1 Tax=Amblyomma americanum TaxID=6943 RepID=A0AAQ4EJW0_AMBAM
MGVLAWINRTLGYDIKDLNELASGTAYCELVNHAFPGTIRKTLIKYGDNLKRHEKEQHFRTLRRSLSRVGEDVELNVEKLVSGGYEEHQNFARWLMEFCERRRIKSSEAVDDVQESAVSSSEANGGAPKEAAAPSSEANADAPKEKLWDEKENQDPGESESSVFMKKATFFRQEREKTLKFITRQRNSYFDHLMDIGKICRTAKKQGLQSKWLDQIEEIIEASLRVPLTPDSELSGETPTK